MKLNILIIDYQNKPSYTEQMNFKKRFKEQVAIITGGASGIGLAIGTRVLQEGGTVVLIDIDQKQLESVKGTMTEWGDQLDIKRADISIEREVRNVFTQVISNYGKVDIVVNSAGIVGPTGISINEYDGDSFEKVISVNLTGSFNITKHAINSMLPTGYGRILLIASIAGKEGNPGMVGYSTSKAGVIGLVKAVGKEYAETNITVNSIAPAVIATPMNLETSETQLKYMKDKIPMRRLGTIEEAASLACWIVSKECSFTTGFIFDLSGGRATY